MSKFVERKLVTEGQLDMQGNYLLHLLDLQAALGTLTEAWIVKRAQSKYFCNKKKQTRT